MIPQSGPIRNSQIFKAIHATKDEETGNAKLKAGSFHATIMGARAVERKGCLPESPPTLHDRRVRPKPVAGEGFSERTAGSKLQRFLDAKTGKGNPLAEGLRAV